MRLIHGKQPPQDCNGAREEYDNHLMATLLEQSQEQMPRMVDRSFWPTYSDYRVYKEELRRNHGFDQKPHQKA